MIAVGCAVRDADLGIGEEGGNNSGPQIRAFALNADPPIHESVPWCALAVQKWSDVGAKALGVDNPLDEVRLEAYVQNYYDTLKHLEIEGQYAECGDLVLYSFGGKRWDHIGLVVRAPEHDGSMVCVEGNTSSESQRDGDAVAVKERHTHLSYDVTFIDWTR